MIGYACTGDYGVCGPLTTIGYERKARMTDDTLVFAEESTGPPDPDESSMAWKVMIVDDNEDVHSVTRLVLDDFAFEGRKVHCISAYSGEEACKAIDEHPDTAVMLLDVVMETRHAGLEVAQYIRTKAQNPFVRIILRTGQPGEAPEQQVVNELDINDYRSKTELTSDRLVTAMTTAIRSYRDIKTINDSRRGLHLLAMSVAHQIRNRTVAIAGFANIIKRKSASSPDVASHLNTILEESSRLENMVGEVTQYAAVESAIVRPSNIRELLEETMDLVDQKATEDGSSVTWDVFCPDQPILVDPDLFVKAFEAIMQNSVDFSGDNPKITIRVTPGRMACVVEVKDYGSGIAETDLPHIFDPFFSLKPRGSGMGLAIVQKVAMEHQWNVMVDSVLGEGTSVRVVVPRRELTGVA